MKLLLLLLDSVLATSNQSKSLDVRMSSCPLTGKDRAFGVTPPKVSILPPSSTEISSKSTATLLCVASVTPPKVSILPPSSTEISSKSTATLLCVASEGFPSDWSLSWKVDGSSSRSQDSSAGLLQKDGLYSWSSSLTLSEQQWMKSVSVSCEATRSGQPAVTQQLTRDQCSQ
ncbi:hypothetical protein Q8A67_000233 [Cirrhinus molitorella]|uniref:Ig-like domain-containing protein n=1 Tax=Cirrhinus molitorella TaxID=172907 RepID=A0AA88QN78_9TELE|nr:hypothetical protein Q8A67_000233 [Cirrhinus molitorella]